nr:Pycsar system effector family protein [uncultured Cellulosilyticum sp.]
MANEKYTKDDAYHTLDLINSWINNVDAKTSFALAFVTVLIGFVFANDLPATFIEIVQMDKITVCTILKIIIILGLYVASFLSILFMFLAIKARISKTPWWEKIFTRNSIKETNSKSIMFFGTIAAMELNAFKAKAMNIDDREIIKDLLEQVHTNSEICMKKMKFYNIGILWLITATILCFIGMVFRII